MKLLVLLSRIPYPLDKGDKLRAYYQLKQLSRDFEIKVVALDDSNSSERDQEKLRNEFDIQFVKLSKTVIYLKMFRALFSDKPFQVHYFFQRSANLKVKEIVSEFKPDHIYCQLIRTAEYVKNIHSIPKTMDYMDAFSKGMDRRISQNRGIKKFLIKAEASRLLKYENLIFDYFENKTIISSQDQSLIYHPERNSIKVVPNGVDFDFFNPDQSPNQTFDLVFTGNMSYPPNVDGALFLVNEIMPIVWKKMPKAKVLIAGAKPTTAITSLKCSNVVVSGWVDDIRESYSSSSVFIAPMRIGTGLQNKLLEAMSMGVPCITTAFANNALKAVNGESILIGNSKESLAELVINLLNDSVLRKNLSIAGRAFIEANYSWRTSTALLIDSIKHEP
ncbi:MAG: glycosyltransferase [Crocinitomicaceae bacterium]|jgi:sugar transferase (PEP-CTERM/EpsH1 system associated)|nr:glycosyltransferase [Crocinitomicaceae bacterium]MBT6513618.1 glycosyltransferase [Crocinitomicaceae bacterium]